MNSSLGDALVRDAVALHLEIAPELVRPETRLRADLGLDPLDLVLIVLRIEDVAGTELPVGELEDVHTIAELQAFVRRYGRARDTEPAPEPRTASGIRPLVGTRRRVGT
jgi:acyl carrier protein